MTRHFYASVGVVITLLVIASLLQPSAQALVNPAPVESLRIQSNDLAFPAVVRVDNGALRTGTPLSIAREFLSEYQTTFPIPGSELMHSRTQTDDLGFSHVRLDQSHRGIPIFGAQLVVHMRNENGGYRVTSVNGRVHPDVQVPPKPVTSAEWASRFASNSLGKGSPSSEAELVVLPLRGKFYLAWHVTLEAPQEPARYEVFVGALQPKVLFSYNSMPDTHGAERGTGVNSFNEVKDVEAFHHTDLLYYLWDTTRPMYHPTTAFSPMSSIAALNEGVIATYEATSAGGNVLISMANKPVNVWLDSPAAVEAHHYSGVTFDYFNAFGRASLDDGVRIPGGMSIVSWVNWPMCNAYWTGTRAVYGNGDCNGDGAPEQKPYSAAIDVVAHELTHGVTQYSSNLIYRSQSGAMNEAYSDYFGNAVENNTTGRTDGRLGEDVCLTRSPDCFIRDMNVPRTMDNWNFGGGVHSNSPIYSNALWEIRDHFRTGFDPPQTDLADRVMYRALTYYLFPDATFVDGREATLLAAQDLGVPQVMQNVMSAEFDENKITWQVLNSFESSGYGVALQRLSQYSPVTDGNRIAWLDISSDFYGKVHVFDTSTGTLSEFGYDSWAVDLSGNRLVWMDFSEESFTWEVWTASLPAGTPERVGPTDLDQLYPRVDGDVVVWTQFDGAQWDAWYDDLSNADPPAPISDDPVADEFLPVVGHSGGVAWTAWEHYPCTGGICNDADIFTRSLPDGVVTDRTDAPGWQFNPEISGRTVLYTEGPNIWPMAKVLSMDAAAGDSTTVAQGSIDWYTAIDGSTSVYSKLDSNGFDIFSNNISGTAESNVSKFRGDEGVPGISGTRIVWESTGNFDSDIISNLPVESLAPAVVSRLPGPDSPTLPANGQIKIRFSEEMDARRINPGTFVVTDNGAPVLGRVTYDIGGDATFTPNSPFVAGRSYEVTLSPPSGRMRDTRGNFLPVTTWIFPKAKESGGGGGGGGGGGPLACAGSVGDFTAQLAQLRGGAYVAGGDVDGDGCTEVIVGVGESGSSAPTVSVFNRLGSSKLSFNAYNPAFKGGVRVAAGDVDGDGKDEIITSPGPGGGPHVRVFDVVGTQAVEKFGFMAYSKDFRGGVFVAAGNTVGSANEEIITGAGSGGGPHVKVFSGSTPGKVLAQRFAYNSNFRGGVTVAAGNFDSDAFDEVATGPGAGGGPHVRVFDQSSSSLVERYGFMAYAASFRGGVFVAGGDVVPGDPGDELIVGAGAGGGPHVTVRRGQNAMTLKSYYAYASSFRGGVRVAAGDSNGNGNGEEITAPGAGMPPSIRQFE